ncbi:MAG: branched-chain amino acid ABC transporter permease [Thermoprotei archaeon]|nr:MAG: branched-chain amino acid ABC transporter permease [Thermoprotei archaeon]
MVSPADLVNAIVSGILVGSVYSLIAMGLALIWGVMNIINFAHGDFMMLGAFIAYWMFRLFGLDPLLCIPLSFGTIFLLGVLVQKGIIDRILEAPLISQIAATFALVLIIRYGAEAWFGPFTRRIVTGYSGEVINLGSIILPLTRLLAFVVSIIVALALYLFLTRTYVGTALRATSQDREAAQLHGINVSAMYKLAFGLGVGIAAIGGVLLSTFYPIYPEMGAYFCLLAFIIVVFGGFGSVFGAYVSGLIIGVTQCVSALFIMPTLKDVVAFLLFILIILFKPTGLFGKGG